MPSVRPQHIQRPGGVRALGCHPEAPTDQLRSVTVGHDDLGDRGQVPAQCGSGTRSVFYLRFSRHRLAA